MLWSVVGKMKVKNCCLLSPYLNKIKRIFSFLEPEVHTRLTILLLHIFPSRVSTRSWWMLPSPTGLGMVTIRGRQSQDTSSDSSSTGSSLTGGQSGPGARSTLSQTLSMPLPTSWETCATINTFFTILMEIELWRELVRNKCCFISCWALWASLHRCLSACTYIIFGPALWLCSLTFDI